jgi:hypothetical protein
MKLMNILFEDDGQDQDNSKGLRRIKNIALFTKETPIEKVEDALGNLNNYKDAGYGQYVTYQRQADPSINPVIQKAFGPGGGPNMKIPANRKEWNAADKEWRLKKAKDIQSRTGLDIAGWEDLSYDELPKEATNWKVFYPQSSIEAMVPIILDITQKSDILKWVEEDGMVVFPRKDNKTIPNDDTLEKVLKTIMKNAGIEDFTIKPVEAKDETSSEPKTKEPEKVAIPSYNITSTPDGGPLSIEDAEDLKDDLEIKVSELKPGASDLKIKVVPSKQNPDNALIQISGFKSSKERSTIQQKVQNVINRLFEQKLKKAFQVRAGIIK